MMCPALSNMAWIINFFRFKIGRETDPSKSEVARLIQQSIEQDRRRDDVRKNEQQRLEKMHQDFKPQDEVMEHEYLDHRDDETEEKKVRLTADCDVSIACTDMLEN